jgi:hypothetical protein
MELDVQENELSSDLENILHKYDAIVEDEKEKGFRSGGNRQKQTLPRPNSVGPR